MNGSRGGGSASWARAELLGLVWVRGCGCVGGGCVGGPGDSPTVEMVM